MRIERPLRAVSRAGWDLQSVMHADARDADHAVDVLDITFYVTFDAIGVIGDLTNCQGP